MSPFARFQPLMCLHITEQCAKLSLPEVHSKYPISLTVSLFQEHILDLADELHLQKVKQVEQELTFEREKQYIIEDMEEIMVQHHQLILHIVTLTMVDTLFWKGRNMMQVWSG